MENNTQNIEIVLGEDVVGNYEGTMDTIFNFIVRIPIEEKVVYCNFDINYTSWSSSTFSSLPNPLYSFQCQFDYVSYNTMKISVTTIDSNGRQTVYPVLIPIHIY